MSSTPPLASQRFLQTQQIQSPRRTAARVASLGLAVAACVPLVVSLVVPMGCATDGLTSAQVSSNGAGSSAAATVPPTAIPAEPPAGLAPDRQLPSGKYIPSTRPADAAASFGPGVTRLAAGSFPNNAALLPGGKYAVVTTQGYRQALTVVDLATGQMASKNPVEQPRDDRSAGLYYGLAVGDDGMVYVGRGSHGTVGTYQASADGTLAEGPLLKGRKGDNFAGVAVDARRRVFAASNCPTNDQSPLNSPGAVVVFDAAGGAELGRYEFPSVAGTTNYPLAVTVARDGARLYVSSQRDNAVYVFDAADAANLKLIKKIDVGADPVALLLDEKQGRLFVANSDSDTVSIIDTASLAVQATLPVRPTAAQNLPSAQPTGLALTPDGETLYVTCSNLNSVAVIDVGERELEGFIPAGWFPTAVATNGEHLMVVNGKGTTTRYPKPTGRNVSPLTFIEGDVLTRAVPDKAELKTLTAQALEYARVTPGHFRQNNPLKHLGVEHVIYIIKENRTYDQVLGDLPQGNGDPAYVMFGRDVTPNQHALAERFVLFDNFFDCGDVSGEGWVWSTQATANEYVMRNVPYNYSGRGRQYDFEGSNNGYPTGGIPAKDADGKLVSPLPKFANGSPPVRDVAYSPGGALWDLCKANGKTYRNYGMFTMLSGTLRAAEGETKTPQIVIPDNYPATANLQPGGRDLAGLTNIDFRRYDTSYADSSGPQQLFESTGDEAYLRPLRAYGKYNSPSRFAEWKREFDLMLAQDPSGKAVPQFMFIRLGNDHTEGLRAGRHSPRAQVADNDYAVGEVVEAVSHSPVWGKTAIFILEDDAQNGPDHVDTHRSICFVVSPLVRRATVDHSFHNTVSCIRTMELLLGLPPMTVNDAAAKPMMIFSDTPDNAEPFVAIKPNAAVLKEKNPSRESASLDPRLLELMDEAETMNFEVADKVPAEALNRQIWASVHGFSRPMPETPQGPLNHAAGDHDDD